ncbi:MAG TPA: hypothetical protein PLZ43_13350 [bacterium]|nr:hypothetical protein [bacterium]
MSGLYQKANGDILEYYQGQGSAYNLTKGKVEPMSSLETAELIEELPEAA